MSVVKFNCETTISFKINCANIKPYKKENISTIGKDFFLHLIKYCSYEGTLECYLDITRTQRQEGTYNAMQ